MFRLRDIDISFTSLNNANSLPINNDLGNTILFQLTERCSLNMELVNILAVAKQVCRSPPLVLDFNLQKNIKNKLKYTLNFCWNEMNAKEVIGLISR